MIDHTGAVWPLGVPIGQSWRELGAILAVLNVIDADAFVEIGIDQGGLSSLMHARRTLGGLPCRYLGVELHPEKIYGWVREALTASHSLLAGDAFAPEVVQRVAGAILQSRRAFLYCDGGDKAREVQTYAPLLRLGDVLGVHDLGIEIQREQLAVAGVTWQEIGGEWGSLRQAFLWRIG